MTTQCYLAIEAATPSTRYTSTFTNYEHSDVPGLTLVVRGPRHLYDGWWGWWPSSSGRYAATARRSAVGSGPAAAGAAAAATGTKLQALENV